MAREQRDLLGIEMHRVHRDQVRPEKIQAPQPLERPHAMLGQRALHFVLGLVHVHVHRQIELGGEHHHLAQARIRDRVRCVRRHAERSERLIAVAVA